jgi:D-alanine-D-alanine ligase
MNKKRVAIICGGPSSEHEISCVSASGILKHIDCTQFDPVLIGITKKQKWVLLPLDYPLAIVDRRLPTVSDDFPEVTRSITGFTVGGANLHIDIAFPVLHGTYGEDGGIQRDLETCGIPYVGSKVAASEIAMDKALSKESFAAVGIDVAPGFAVEGDEWIAKPFEITARAQTLGLPLFVKSARGGSSRGTVKVKSIDAFSDAMHEALKFDTKVLIEGAVIGSEVECAVLEKDGELFASIPGKVVIDPRFDFYDFEAKYLDGATHIDIPAPLGVVVSLALISLSLLKTTSLLTKSIRCLDKHLHRLTPRCLRQVEFQQAALLAIC